MSGIAGALAFDRQEPVASIARELVSAMPHRARDGASFWAGPGAALGYASTEVLPGADEERQPLVTQTGCAVTFDGRLDNRDDLVRALSLDPRASSDASIVAAAYGRWDVECLGRLVGPFALAIWDPRVDRVMLARDVMGLRPLHWARHGARVLWASDLHPLVRASSSQPAINEGFIAELLADRVTSATDSPYAGVSRLAPGTVLTIRRDTSPDARRFWSPSYEARPPASFDSYVEAFEEACRTATRASLRGRGFVLSLSGGDDSAAIAACIDDARREHAMPPVSAATMALDGSDDDECATAAEVARRTAVPWTRLPTHLASAADVVGSARPDAFPEMPNSLSGRPLREHAAALGVRSMLTGFGGDEWFAPQLGELAALLRRRRPLAAAAWLYHVARRPRHPMGSPGSLLPAAWMAVPPGAKPLLRAVLRRPRPLTWLEPAFAERVSLQDRIRAGDLAPGASLAEAKWHDATSADAVLRTEELERFTALHGLEERYPLMDRRIAELALSIPVAAHHRHGVPKAIIRRFLERRLPGHRPQSSADRDFSWITASALDALGGREYLADTEPIRRGWVVPARIGDLYDVLQRGAAGPVWILWGVVAVDLLLRRRLSSTGGARTMTPDFVEVS